MGAASDPPLRGEEPRRKADALAAAFDVVVASGTPRWVRIEGNTGAGKTRLVQELYRTLASRQDDPGYWPPSILAAVPEAQREALTSVGARRKRTYPQVVRPAAGATPHWFWWGVSCGTQAGSEVQAIAADLAQFAAHRDGLEARWREVTTIGTKLRDAARRRRTEVIETGADEAIGMAASAANLAVPGLGFVLMAAKWGVQGVRDRVADDPGVIDASGTGRPDLVGELAPALARLAGAGIPIVIVVEDLHEADPALVALLARLLGEDEAPILLVTTSWPGLAAEAGRPVAVLGSQVPDDRLAVLSVESDDLEPSARRHVVDDLDVALGDEVVDALAGRYRNPLALQLAATLLDRRAREGRSVEPASVAAMPADVRELAREAWRQLPPALQRVLAVGALLRPSSVSDLAVLRDHRWDRGVVEEVADALPFVASSVAELEADLDTVTTAYGWVRMLDDWDLARSFHDETQSAVAAQAAEDDLGPDREALYAAASTSLDRVLDDGGAPAIHAARLLVALASEGFLPWHDPSRRALALLMGESMERGSNPDQSALLLMSARALEASAGEDSPVTLALRLRHGRMLTETGRLSEGLEALRAVYDDSVRLLGPDHRETLIAGACLVNALYALGRLEDAIELVEQVIDGWTRTVGPRHPRTLAARGNLATLLGESGQADEAVEAFTTLLVDRTEVHGADHPSTLMVRNHRARWLGHAGRVDEALAAFESLLADQLELSGPRDPHSLIFAGNVAYWLAEAGRLDEAAARMEQVVEDCTEVHGPRHPRTLLDRHNLASIHGRAGRSSLAIEQYTTLLADRLQVHDPTHPVVLRTRNNLALELANAGWLEDAVAELTEVADVAVATLGPRHPDTLLWQCNLALHLERAGDPDEAIALLEVVVAGRSEVLGPRHRDTLSSRLDLLASRASVAGDETVSAELTAFVDEAAEALGPRDELTLDGRDHLALALRAAGRTAEAVAVQTEALAARTELHGEQDPRTIEVRERRASFLLADGRRELGLAELDAVLTARWAVQGPTHPMTLQTAVDLAGWLDHSGAGDQALVALQAMVPWCETTLGPAHPTTAEGRELLEAIEQRRRDRAAGDP